MRRSTAPGFATRQSTRAPVMRLQPLTAGGAYVPATVAAKNTCSASRTAEHVSAKAIVVYTESGATARLLSSQRPAVQILALSPEVVTVRRLSLSWGVYPRLMPRVNRMAEMMAVGERLLIEAGHVRPGDRVVVVSGSRAANRGGTNMMKILTVGELD